MKANYSVFFFVSRPQEGLEHAASGAVNPRIADLAEAQLALLDLVVGAQDASQHLAHVAPLVPVLEQADVVLGPQGGEELLEGAGARGGGGRGRARGGH